MIIQKNEIINVNGIFYIYKKDHRIKDDGLLHECIDCDLYYLCKHIHFEQKKKLIGICSRYLRFEKCIDI